MQTRTCIAASAVVLAALLVASATAGAAKRVTGKLSKPGYTVIALATNGTAKSVRAPRGKFRLKAPAKTVTLHLRARGKYAGPIVVGKRSGGRRAIVGIRTGARLGRVAVRRGFARARPARRWLDTSRYARAKRGVPIGANRYGRVRSRQTHGGVPGDRDLDGIPDALDIDDDGDRVLDSIDRSRSARAAQSDDVFTTHFDLGVGLQDTANANAGSSDEEIDAALPNHARIDIHILPGDSAELDCGQPQSRSDPRLGGLIYCTRGGTGEVPTNPPRPGVPQEFAAFPECCDADADGFGTLANNAGDREPNQGLFPRATAEQIGTGDILIQRVMRSGVEHQSLTALQYVFGTTPALVAYDDGRGNDVTVEYPVAGSTRGSPAPGTPENGFPVEAGPNGDVVAALTFWRPQRRPIPPETAPWIDIGGLNYVPGVAGMDIRCEQDTMSEADPNLVVAPPETVEAGGFRDRAPDLPASSANTLTYTLNMSRCLRANGFSFSRGENRGFKFSALSPNDANGGETEQTIHFTRR